MSVRRVEGYLGQAEHVVPGSLNPAAAGGAGGGGGRCGGVAASYVPPVAVDGGPGAGLASFRGASFGWGVGPGPEHEEEEEEEVEEEGSEGEESDGIGEARFGGEGVRASDLLHNSAEGRAAYSHAKQQQRGQPRHSHAHMCLRDITLVIPANRLTVVVGEVSEWCGFVFLEFDPLASVFCLPMPHSFEHHIRGLFQSPVLH